MSDTPRVVLVISPGAGYERGLLRGIARYVRNHGPWAFFISGDQPGIPVPTVANTRLKLKSPSARHQLSHHPASAMRLKDIGATGFIGRISEPRIAEAVLASGLPAIVLDMNDEQLATDNPLSQLSEVCPDSHKAGRLAAEHLLDRGFQRFGFFGYPNENWSRRRLEGFRERLRQSGFECVCPPMPVRKSLVPWHREQPHIATWLKSLPKPVGILASNDVRGRQVIETCALSGIHVPDDVAVVGVDEDHILSEFSNPPLSSVALAAEQAGYQAAELLDGMMSGRIERRRHLILADALWVVARPSTDVIAIEDRDVANAVQYIRENAKQSISVQDVVERAAISRRSLEIRFQRTLGRSIRAEIERVRLNWVRQLLLETNMPVSKIADCTGFTDLSYLSKVFRRTMGSTITSYRREHGER